MKAPNSELFRLLRFAIRFRGWSTYQDDARVHVIRGEALGFFEVDRRARRFRLLGGDGQVGEALDAIEDMTFSLERARRALEKGREHLRDAGDED
jgi:hypothetical protein